MCMCSTRAGSSMKAVRSWSLGWRPRATTTSSRNSVRPKTKSVLRQHKEETMAVAPREIQKEADYKFGFHDEEDYFFKARRGLNEDIVRQISEHKQEPEWM